MFAKVVSRGSVGKFQKTLMVTLVLVVFFSAFPIERVQAAIIQGYVRCNTPQNGYYQYELGAIGDFIGQWIYYQLVEYAVLNDGREIYLRTLPAVNDYYKEQARTSTLGIPYTYPARTIQTIRNFRLKVVTIVWLRDITNTRWLGPYYSQNGHIFYNPVLKTTSTGANCWIY